MRYHVQSKAHIWIGNKLIMLYRVTTERGIPLTPWVNQNTAMRFYFDLRRISA